MGWGYGNVGSSSSGGLNFKILWGDTAPQNPKENTIFVETQEKITGWSFSPTRPTEPISGMIWIRTGISGRFKMNALKKNAIVLYLQSCEQYISNNWVNVSSEIFQNGAWNDYGILYLYDNGNDVEYNWLCTEQLKQTNSGYTSESMITESGGKFSVENQTRAYSFTDVFVADKNNAFVKIDLSPFSKISVKADVSNATKNTACVLRLISEFGSLATDNNVLAVPLYSGSIDSEIDISAISEECYIGFTFYNENTKFTPVQIALY